MDLSPSLTCRLLTASRSAWQELTDADVRVAGSARYSTTLGGIAALLTSLIMLLRPTQDFGEVVRTTLAAFGSNVGATAVALAVVPACLRGLQLDQARVVRYATAAALPLAVSGCAVLLPSLASSFIAIALLSALAYLSGSRGAATFLALRGADRARVATLASLAPTLPALLLATLQALR